MAPSGFPSLREDDDDFENDNFGSSSRRGNESSSSAALPIVTFVPPFQMSTKSKVTLLSSLHTATRDQHSQQRLWQSQIWVDTHGVLHTFDGLCSVRSSSSSANRIQRGKWQVLTVVVDCVEREMEVYLDGVCVHSNGTATTTTTPHSDDPTVSVSGSGSGVNKGLTPPGMEIDSHYSIAGELSLFDDLQPPSSQGTSHSIPPLSLSSLVLLPISHFLRETKLCPVGSSSLLSLPALFTYNRSA
jgi:hypothetical protein